MIRGHRRYFRRNPLTSNGWKIRPAKIPTIGSSATASLSLYITDAERAAAVLHDVVEDTHVTFEGLREAGIPEDVIAAVDCVTKRNGEAYDDYLDRVTGNPIARRVKLADLEDNMRVDRLVTVTDRDLKRLEKYGYAKQRLSLENA
jgi:hypothetical protein